MKSRIAAGAPGPSRTRAGVLRLAGALLLATVAAGAPANRAVADIRSALAGRPGISAPAAAALPDSARMLRRHPSPADSGAIEFQPGNWDSVTAEFDQSIKPESRRRVTPVFEVRYSKVEGVHLGAGASHSLQALRLDHIEGRFGYDLGRERPTGSGLLEFGLLKGGGLIVEAEAHSRARAFGDYNPYGNTVMALVAGFDAREYLLDREGRIGIGWGFSPGRRLELSWVRVRQDSLRAIARAHLSGTDYWMRHNPPADHVVENGIRLAVETRPAYTGETRIRGLVVNAEAIDYGGALLGGTREYSVDQASVWFTQNRWDGSAWQFFGSGGVVTGRSPVQGLLDLGGSTGLRGFPPRGEGSSLVLVGRTRLLARAEFQKRADIWGHMRVKSMRSLRLRLVPFTEVGSCWGAQPILSGSDLRDPEPSEVHWDLGAGLRTDLDYTGFLSFAEIDFAWPMGQDRGPARIAFRLSSNGLD